MVEGGAVPLDPTRVDPVMPALWSPSDAELQALLSDHDLADADGGADGPGLLTVPDRAGGPVPAGEVDDTVLLGWAEALGASGEAAAWLDQVNPHRLDRAGQLRLAACWARLAAHAAAGKLVAVAAFAGPELDPDGPDGLAARDGNPDFTDCHVAGALGQSSVGGAKTVTLARTLTARLPGTLALLATGRIGLGHAHVLAELTEPLTPVQCTRIEALVLDRAVEQTPAQLRRSARTAIARTDPDALRRKERAARAFTGVQTSHDDDGHGQLLARGPSAGISLVDLWTETYARSAKAAGDPRPLPQLRVAALVSGAEHYFTGCPATGRPAPTEHGRPITINISIDLPTFLGLTDHPAEILGTGALIPADALVDLLPDAQLRRLITDPLTGELLDYGRTTYRVPADLAAFTTFRDITSTAPGSLVPAGLGDKDHAKPFDPDRDDGGRTDRDNIVSANRRWHRAKTLGGWTVVQNPDHTWTWTGRYGQHRTTRPHDYRLGP